MALDRRDKRRQRLGEAVASFARERRGNADVAERAVVVVEAEEKRADPLPRREPAEASDDALGRPLRLHLEHRAPARLVRSVDRLRDDAVHPAAGEAVEPGAGELGVPRQRRHADGGGRRGEDRLQPRATALERRRGQVLGAHGEKIEGDEYGWRLAGEGAPPGGGPLDAGPGRRVSGVTRTAGGAAARTASSRVRRRSNGVAVRSSAPTARRSKATNTAGASAARRSTREAAGCRRAMSVAKSERPSRTTSNSPSRTNARSASERSGSATSGK